MPEPLTDAEMIAKLREMYEDPAPFACSGFLQVHGLAIMTALEAADATAKRLAECDRELEELQYLRELGEDMAVTAYRVHQMLLEEHGQDYPCSLGEKSGAFTIASGKLKSGGCPVHDRISDLERQVAGLPAWRPIESAPKTRQSIIVYCPGNECVYIVSWHNWGERPGWFHFGPPNERLLSLPTHWMPLPAFPQ